MANFQVVQNPLYIMAKILHPRVIGIAITIPPIDGLIQLRTCVGDYRTP